jgi:hypothetical protein
MTEEDPTAIEPDEADLPDKPAIDIPKEPVKPPTDQEVNEAEEPEFMHQSEATDDDTVDNQERPE